MKCGNCYEDHNSVAVVRSCYAGSKPAPAEDNPFEFKQNRYPGACVRCGAEVPAEEGRVDKNERGKWEVSHLSGQCPQATVTRIKPAAPEQVGTVVKRFRSIPAGYYAVESLTGNNDLDFFRVDRPEDGTWKGHLFVKRVVGGRPNAPVKARTREKALQAILAATPEKAAIRYGQQIGRCYCCNRHLTDETSRTLGIGPDCRSKSR